MVGVGWCCRRPHGRSCSSSRWRTLVSPTLSFLDLLIGRGEMRVPAKIAPSMLSSNFSNLASEAQRMLDCGADWLHMDIMVRHFVPNLTIGAPVIKSLRKHTKAYLDCHLMVTNPLDYVQPLGEAGASGLTFHVEASKENWRQIIQEIKLNGMRPGVAIRPGTPIEEVYPLVESENPAEMVLVMTVEPGFGGQKFMPEMMVKVQNLRKRYPSLDIEVDGGLGPSTIEWLLQRELTALLPEAQFSDLQNQPKSYCT